MLVENWFFQPMENYSKFDEIDAYMASIFLLTVALIFFIASAGIAVKFLYDFLEITLYRYKGRKYIYHKSSSKSKRQ